MKGAQEQTKGKCLVTASWAGQIHFWDFEVKTQNSNSRGSKRESNVKWLVRRWMPAQNQAKAHSKQITLEFNVNPLEMATSKGVTKLKGKWGCLHCNP